MCERRKPPCWRSSVPCRGGRLHRAGDSRSKYKLFGRNAGSFFYEKSMHVPHSSLEAYSSFGCCGGRADLSCRFAHFLWRKCPPLDATKSCVRRRIFYEPRRIFCDAGRKAQFPVRCLHEGTNGKKQSKGALRAHVSYAFYLPRRLPLAHDSLLSMSRKHVSISSTLLPLASTSPPQPSAAMVHVHRSSFRQGRACCLALSYNEGYRPATRTGTCSSTLQTNSNSARTKMFGHCQREPNEY